MESLATVPEPIRVLPATLAPYVGLRPYEREERDWFFGRDQDARLLHDKILASRLTILYSLSGRGKSSLLRALVIPQLEASPALVIPFEDWAQPDSDHGPQGETVQCGHGTRRPGC